jgi:hypothetical protein
MHFQQSLNAKMCHENDVRLAETEINNSFSSDIPKYPRNPVRSTIQPKKGEVNIDEMSMILTQNKAHSLS